MKEKQSTGIRSLILASGSKRITISFEQSFKLLQLLQQLHHPTGAQGILYQNALTNPEISKLKPPYLILDPSDHTMRVELDSITEFE